jgi:hypothetical protein
MQGILMQEDLKVLGGFEIPVVGGEFHLGIATSPRYPCVLFESPSGQQPTAKVRATAKRKTICWQLVE